jgi:hypothetical protein
VRAQLEDLGERLQRSGVAVVVHDPLVLVLHLAATLVDLLEDHADGLQHVERLEARHDDRLLVVGGDELERPRTHHGRDVARADEPVESHVRRVEQRAQRRDDRHVAAHAREVRDVLNLGPLQRERRGGRGGLEPDREEDDLLVRVLLGNPEGIERRVDHAHVGAVGLCVEQRTVRARDPQHVPEAREDHVLLMGKRDAIVHATHRDHAYGTPRTVHQLDVLGQEIIDPELVDRVRVASADLHQLVVAARLHQRQDVRRKGLA